LYVETSFKVRMIAVTITSLMKCCILHLKVVVFVVYCPHMFLETLNMATRNFIYTLLHIQEVPNSYSGLNIDMCILVLYMH
jgi:hypothetical protein